MTPHFKTMKQVIHGICPSKSNCYRVNQHTKGLYKTKALTDYEKSFYLQCNIYRNKNIGEQFEIYLDVFYPSQRADLDNALKVVMDSLQHCKAIVNDRSCVKIVAQKYMDKANPRIEFEIKKI